jgi:hypothetical protein
VAGSTPATVGAWRQVVVALSTGALDDPDPDPDPDDCDVPDADPAEPVDDPEASLFEPDPDVVEVLELLGFVDPERLSVR